MTTPGSLSTIFASTQKLLQAKAQNAWKNLAQTTPATAQPAIAKANAGTTSPSTLITLVDPEAREKLQTMQQDAESLSQKLSAGTESKREAAMRKADEAKRRLKSLKMQAQMAAASGDTKAAARIAREVAQVAKQLGQAMKEYGGSGADAAAALGSVASSGQQTTANADTANAEASSSGSDTTAAGTVSDKGDGNTGGEQQSARENYQDPPVDDPPTEATSDSQAVMVDTLGQPANSPVTTNTGIEEKRAAIASEGAQRKADMEFYSDTRGTMAQLRSILEQMKKVARREGSVGMAAQMDQAARDMAEGERLLTEATSPGIIALPAGSLVQVSA